MHFADLFLNKLDRSEYRTLRTAGAKSGRPCRDRRAKNFERRPLIILNRFQQSSGRVGADLFRPYLGEELVEAFDQDARNIFAGQDIFVSTPASDRMAFRSFSMKLG